MTDPFLKRIIGELKDLYKNKTDFFQAIQDEDNIKLFYFVLRPRDEPYVGGLFIGKIELPNDYPKSPGSFYMLTPNGRFMTNQKICLTNSNYHKENWTPIWSIRNMVLGVASIFISDDTNGISHIRDSFENRKNFSKNSVQYNIINYPNIFKRFNFFVNEDMTIKSNDEISKIINEKKSKKIKEEEIKEEEIKEEVIKEEEKPKIKRVVKRVVKKKQEQNLQEDNKDIEKQQEKPKRKYVKKIKKDDSDKN
jgi:ubiquitin-conjugating enzyme E2 J2